MNKDEDNSPKNPNTTNKVTEFSNNTEVVMIDLKIMATILVLIIKKKLSIGKES